MSDAERVGKHGKPGGYSESAGSPVLWTGGWDGASASHPGGGVLTSSCSFLRFKLKLEFKFFISISFDFKYHLCFFTSKIKLHDLFVLFDSTKICRGKGARMWVKLHDQVYFSWTLADFVDWIYNPPTVEKFVSLI